jgi:hypothetical protein
MREDFATHHIPPVSLSDIRVSQHAVEQFIRRSGTGRKPEAIPGKLLRMLAHSKELRKKDATFSLLRYNCQPARYFEGSTWILVVVGDTLATCYQGKLSDFEAAIPL